MLIPILAGLAGLMVVGLRCFFDPSIPFLAEHPPAEWIVYRQTYTSVGRQRREWRVRFGTTFVLPEPTRTGRACVRAFRGYVLWVNQTRVNPPGGGDGNWKRVREHDIAPLLRAGENRIEIEVNNDNGPPALWLLLHTDRLMLKTDEQWQVQTERGNWMPVALASEPGRFPEMAAFPSVASGWKATWPVVLAWPAIAAVPVLLGSWWVRRKAVSVSNGLSSERTPTGRHEWVLAGIVVLLWVVLCANNLVWLPPRTGFDVSGHLEYVNLVQTLHQLPKANEGWEMYQPPLYYVLSACLVAVGRCAGLADAHVVLPRVVSMIGGLVQALLVWAAARVVFPNDRPVRCAALVLAAAMPMNLYLSQHCSNEMMCTALVTGGLVLALRILQDGDRRWVRHATLGAVLGLAMLSKYTAVLAVAAVLAVVTASVLASAGNKGRVLLRTVGVALGVVLAVAGWFYVRNWMAFRNPFVGNWDPVTGNSWWIDPGYGTSAYYLRFGRVLSHPFDAWLHSYADSVYSTVWGDSMCSGNQGLFDRPPWHYNLVSVGYILALFPTVLIGIGLVAAVIRWVKAPSALWALLVGHGALVALGVFYMTLKLPYYPQARGFYGLTSMACICTLGAWGFGRLRARLGRFGGFLWIPLLVWAINSYASYLASPLDVKTHVETAAVYFQNKEYDLARWHLDRALRMDPGNRIARLIMADIFCRQERYKEGADLFRETLALDPNDTDTMVVLAKLLSSCQDDAVRDGREALRLSEHLCKITRHEDAGPLDLLACAQAELGRFDEAVRTLTRALRLAEAVGSTEDLAKMRSRLELYKSRKPYRCRYGD